ncbi:MAG: terminase large subunit domain-containing protein [Anaerolineales bacterium]
MKLASMLKAHRSHAERVRFRKNLIMPSGEKLGDVIQPCQQEVLEARDRGLHIYADWPRGSGKTFLGAVMALEALLLGRPGTKVDIYATDEDQARLVHESAVGFLRRTPGLGQVVEITKSQLRVAELDNVVAVLSSDTTSNWGRAPDLLIADEFSMWPSDQNGTDLWTSAWSGLPKRSGKAVVLLTPSWDFAGLAWKLRELAIAHPDRWHYSEVHEPPPWISSVYLDEMRQTLPAHVFERLFLGRWTEAGGAFLTVGEVDGVFVDPLPPVRGGLCAIGVDLSARRDASALAVVRRVGTLYRIEEIQRWTPPRGGEISLDDVMAAIRDASRRYFAAPVHIEEWQATLMGQQLKEAGVPVQVVTPTSAVRSELFQTLLSAIRARQLMARPNEQLRRELLGLEVIDTRIGWKVEPRQQGGSHGDIAMATAYAMRALHQLFNKPRFVPFGVSRP